MLGSTVNTFLTAFPECRSAKILIEGEPCSYGQMDYTQPFAYFTNVDTTILAFVVIEGKEQQGYDAVKISEKETSADERKEYYVIGENATSWVIKITYSSNLGFFFLWIT